MTRRAAKEIAALMLTGFVGIFIVGSLVIAAALAFGPTDSTGEKVWSGLFALTTAIVGAVGGWIGGTITERHRTEETSGNP